MKQVTAYRCEHCGKLYLRKGSCKEHEKKRCCKNPLNMPYCYSCKHYKEEFVEHEDVVYYIDSYFGQDEYSKRFNPNICKHRGCKLYNNINLSADMIVGLEEVDYEPMPTLKTGGCQSYEPVEEHPYAKILKSCLNQ